MRNWSRREYSRRDLERAGEPLGECVTMPKIGGGYICGGGGKGSTPAAPDYTGAAQAQAQSSAETTNMQNYANRPTQNTPWGSVTWGTTAQIDPSTGQPVTQWTQNYNLTPDAQAALDSQLNVQKGRSQLAESFLGRVGNEYSRAFDWGSMPARGGNVDASQFQGLQGGSPQLQASLEYDRNMPKYDSAYVQNIQNQALEYMRPDQERAQSALDAKLANKGITPGSKAYDAAIRQLSDQQSRDKYNALNTAMSQGNQMYATQLGAQNQGYNQALGAAQFGNTARQNQQSLDINRAGFNNQVGQNRFAQEMQRSQYQNQLRQAAIAEEMQRRGMSLNELNALLSGQQVGMQQGPQFNAASAAQPTQYLNAANMQYQSALDASNAQNMASNSTMNGLFNLGGSLGSAATMGFMLSDSRLKKIVKQIGEKNGIRWYLFKYLGSNALYEGPMAQEVQKVKPEAVTHHSSGYLMVNYAALEA